MNQELIIFIYLTVILTSMFFTLICVFKKLIKDSEFHIEAKFQNNLQGFNHLQKQRDKEFERVTERSLKDRARIEYCISLIEKLNR